jgi:hypothetical protein
MGAGMTMGFTCLLQLLIKASRPPREIPCTFGNYPTRCSNREQSGDRRQSKCFTCWAEYSASMELERVVGSTGLESVAGALRRLSWWVSAIGSWDGFRLRLP